MYLNVEIIALNHLIFSCRDNPPSATCLRAITELIERSRQIQNEDGLKGSHFIDLKELKISNIDVSKMVHEVILAKTRLDSFSPAEKIPDFESQVREIQKNTHFLNFYLVIFLFYSTYFSLKNYLLASKKRRGKNIWNICFLTRAYNYILTIKAK